MRNIALSHTMACTQLHRQALECFAAPCECYNFQKMSKPHLINGKVVKHWKFAAWLYGLCPGRQSKMAVALSNLLQLSWLWVRRILRCPTASVTFLQGMKQRNASAIRNLEKQWSFVLLITTVCIDFCLRAGLGHHPRGCWARLPLAWSSMDIFAYVKRVLG